MGKYIHRFLNVGTNYSAFFWSARKKGKSSWIKHNFDSEDSILIDLFKIDIFAEYVVRILRYDLLPSYIGDYENIPVRTDTFCHTP